jgi:serine/threonine-protein kinase
VARFKNEVVQVRKLAHPNIVPIESFGEDGPYFYFVMPLLDGSLRDSLIRQERVAPLAALRSAIQIAAALTAVHALGLIHRDIKPDNILLRGDHALLTDFGIVRQVTFTNAGQPPTLAGSGLPIGTPQYMAPEQLAGRQVDHRADLYALGAVLYELLTGQPPHIADTPFTIASRVLNEPIRPPSTLNPAIPRDLDAVVMRALARDPADRYASAASMRDALERIAEWLRRETAGAGGAERGERRGASHRRGDAGGAETRDSNGRMRADTNSRRGAFPALIVGLAAVLLLMSLFCIFNLALSGRLPGENNAPPTSTLSYDPTYEAMAATATVLEQTPTVTTGPNTPTPTPRPPLPTRTPTPRPPTVTVGPGTATPTPYPTDTPAPTPTDTPTATPTETPTDTPTATPTDTPGP